MFFGQFGKKHLTILGVIIAGFLSTNANGACPEPDWFASDPVFIQKDKRDLRGLLFAREMTRQGKVVVHGDSVIAATDIEPGDVRDHSTMQGE